MPLFSPSVLPAIAMILAVLLGMAAGPVGRHLAGCAEAGPQGWRRLLPVAAVLALSAHALLVLPSAQALPAVILAAVLVAIAAADLETMLIPDALSLPLIPLGLLLTAATAPDGQAWAALALHGIAAAAGYLLVWGLALLWRRMRGIDAIGLGDAKLLAAAGAWVGPAGLPGVLLYASVAGLLAALIWQGLKGGRLQAGMAIPFGPFLALGFWLVAIHGPPGL